MHLSLQVKAGIKPVVVYDSDGGYIQSLEMTCLE